MLGGEAGDTNNVTGGIIEAPQSERQRKGKRRGKGRFKPGDPVRSSIWIKESPMSMRRNGTPPVASRINSGASDMTALDVLHAPIKVKLHVAVSPMSEAGEADAMVSAPAAINVWVSFFIFDLDSVGRFVSEHATRASAVSNHNRKD